MDVAELHGPQCRSWSAIQHLRVSILDILTLCRLKPKNPSLVTDGGGYSLQISTLAMYTVIFEETRYFVDLSRSDLGKADGERVGLISQSKSPPF